MKQQRISARWKTLKRLSGTDTAPWPLTTALGDPRLTVGVCGAHHKEESPVPIPHEADFWAAVEEYGLAPDLPRWLGKRYDRAAA